MTARTEAELAAAMYGGAATAPASPPVQTQAEPRSEAELAAAIYGKPAAQSARAAAAGGSEPAAARTREQLAEDMYRKPPEPEPVKNLPPAVAELREQDTARQIFTAQSTHGAVDIEAAFEGIEGENITPEVRAAAAAEWREIAVDVGLSVPEAVAVLNEMRHAFAEPPTPEQRQQWRGEIMGRVKERYGDEAEAVVADARRLVARDPRVAQLLQQSGLGDSPDMVLRMCDLARRQRAMGRLR